MKKLITLITTLAVAATFCGAAAAYAEEADGETFAAAAEVTAAETTEGLTYPDFVSEFDEDIGSYAVNGSTFAMAYGRTLYIYSGSTADGYEYTGGTLTEYTINFTIADLAYDGDTLYLSSSGNDTYIFSESDGSTAIGDYSDYFGSNDYVYDSDNRLILEINNATLSALKSGYDEKTFTGTYSMLKQTGGAIYIIRDGKFCKITGSTPDNVTITELSFEYADIAQGEEIAIGDSAELLKTTADSATYVTVPAGQYVTMIDLSDLSGTYFKTVTKNGVHTFALESSMTALVLCASGNAIIVACDGEAYITYSEYLSLTEMTVSDAPFAGGQLLMEAGLYSSPYISESTKIATLAEGATVTVSGELTTKNNAMLEADFCRVSYTDSNGNTVTGYVATGFLTEYEFVTPTEDDLVEEWNDDYSEDNAIITVVLIIVIVVLIIAGVAYLAYFSGAGKRAKKEIDGDDGDDGDYDGDGDGRGRGGNGGYGNNNGYGGYGNSNNYGGNRGYNNFNSGNGSNGYNNGYGNGNGYSSNGGNNNYGGNNGYGGNGGNNNYGGNNGYGGYDE